MAKTFQASLVTPDRQVAELQVEYATIPAWDGQVGVMYNRAPMVAKLGRGLLRLDQAGGESAWFMVGGGFVQVRDNRLSILANEAVVAEEADPEQISKALVELESRQPSSPEEFARRQRDLERPRILRQLIEHRKAGAGSREA